MSKITQRVPHYAIVSSGKLKTGIYNLEKKVAVGHIRDLLLLAFISTWEGPKTTSIDRCVRVCR